MTFAKNKGLMLLLSMGLCSAFAAGCGDTVPNNAGGEISISKPNITMVMGAKEEVVITFKDSDGTLTSTDLAFTSTDEKCANLAAGSSTSTDANGSLTVSIEALGHGCKTDIHVTDKNHTNVPIRSINVTVSELGEPNLKVNAESLELEAGEEKSVEVELTNVPVLDKQLITASSNDPKCVSVADENLTDSSGVAIFKPLAVDEGCEATIDFSYLGGEAVASLFVSVMGAPVDITGAELKLEQPVSGTMTLDVGAKDEIVVRFVKLEGEKEIPVTNQKLSVSTLGQCAVVNNDTSTIRTDGFGKAVIPVEGKKDCIQEADIIAQGKDGVETKKVSVTIIVGTPAEYDLKIKHTATESDNIRDVRQLVTNLYFDADCDTFTQSPVSVENLIPQGSDDRAAANVSDFTNLPSVEFTDMESSQKSVVAVTTGYGENDAQTPIVYGCAENISYENSNITVDLVDFPASLVGEYDLFANFDLSSGFQKQDTYIAEEMKAGDWVQFVVDVTANPLKAALAFLYDNSLSRIDPITVGSFSFDFKNYRDVVVNLGGSMADGYLSELGWYSTLTKVASDVNSLVANMRLEGKFEITDEPDENGLVPVNQTHSYSILRYQLKSVDGDSNPEGRPMPLGAASMSGTWGGSVSDCAADAQNCKSQLSIEDHEIQFKWANILYQAVFSEILPTALGYKDKNEYPNSLSGFLYFAAFDPLVGAFVQSNPSVVLEQTDSCGKLLEVILYLVLKEKASSTIVKGALGIAKPLACETGLGALDKLISDQLSKFDLPFRFSSTQCSMITEGTANYTKMGLPDVDNIGANACFLNEGKCNTVRCKWNAKVNMKDGESTLKGLYHASRKISN